MKTLLGLACASLLLAGCATQAPAPEVNMLAQKNTFKGTLPCADCSGIENTLVLYRNNKGLPTRYELTEKYLGGKQALTVIERGDWVIQPDSLKQADGLDEVFVLSPKDANSRRLFLHNAANAVKLLSRDGSLPQSKLNYTLMKVSGK